MTNLKELQRVTETQSIKREQYDFSKIKVGRRVLEDATFTEGAFQRINPRLADKNNVLRAINERDHKTLREISNFFYETSGIYSRLCRYMAFLYRYDWFITPYVNDEAIGNEKVLKPFYIVLDFLDKFNVKMFFGKVALNVMKNGAYYGYVIYKKDMASVQELPANYCRSRFAVGNRPAIEFNMKYFDDTFRDINQRMRIINLFPPEFQKGYVLYKKNLLPPEFPGDKSGWYLLDTNYAIKFSMNGEDYPMFASVIPAIIDLDEAQELDRKKMAQQLLKIIIQKMPIDKNGDLIFDPDEAQDLHQNAVSMVGGAIGLDILTTYADIQVADMADKSTTTTTDELIKVERAIYNDAGVSQKQFNTDSNMALEKSILNDEASIYNLLLQFEEFLNYLIKPYNKNTKRVDLKVNLLTTTIYNYKDMSKLYKEQMQSGHSKILPQIALGQSQSSILANAYFENEVLDLNSLFIPPPLSSTTSAKDVLAIEEEKTVGRQELPDEQKSEKTIANKESMN